MLPLLFACCGSLCQSHGHPTTAAPPPLPYAAPLLPHSTAAPPPPLHCTTADKRAIPKVDNTNVDRSVATIHTTVLGCLRRVVAGVRELRVCVCYVCACVCAIWHLPSKTMEESVWRLLELSPGACVLAALDAQGESLLVGGGGGASPTCKPLLEEYLSCRSGVRAWERWGATREYRRLV